MQVGVKFEGNVFEKVGTGLTGAKGKADGEVGPLTVVGLPGQKTFHQTVEPWSGGAKGGVEVVGDAVAELGGNDGWQHGILETQVAS